MTCLRQYVKLTEPVRAAHDPLWLSYSKPFKLVSHDTVSRWIKNVLEKAGINTNEESEDMHLCSYFHNGLPLHSYPLRVSI